MSAPESIPCPTCAGSDLPGNVVVNPSWPDGDGPAYETCEDCDGTQELRVNDLPDGMQLYEVGVETIYSDVVYVAAGSRADAHDNALKVEIESGMIVSRAEIVDINIAAAG